MQYRNRDFPKRASENIIALYKTIGRLSIRKLKKEIRRSNLKLAAFENMSNHYIKRFLTKMPVLEELFAGDVCLTLENPVVREKE